MYMYWSLPELGELISENGDDSLSGWELGSEAEGEKH